MLALNPSEVHSASSDNRLHRRSLDPSFLKSKKSELTVFQANIRSINANFNRFEDVFINCNNLPDIICFTETWLHDDSELPTIDGYNFVASNSNVTKNSAGGVGLFISDKHFIYCGGFYSFFYYYYCLNRF